MIVSVFKIITKTMILRNASVKLFKLIYIFVLLIFLIKNAPINANNVNLLLNLVPYVQKSHLEIYLIIVIVLQDTMKIQKLNNVKVYTFNNNYYQIKYLPNNHL